jgi:hypothetical protein
VLKMRALTLQVYVDDIEGEEEGIAETLLDNDTIAAMPRPGTSLRNPGTAFTDQGFRPKTQSGSVFWLSPLAPCPLAPADQSIRAMRISMLSPA